MFGSFGITEIVIAAVVIFLLVGKGVLGRGSGKTSGLGPTLVLRKFKANGSPTDGIFVEIVGRASGFTAWLLTIMKFDGETRLKVTDRELSIRSASLSGEMHQVVSLDSIASTHCGYTKPIALLFVGGFIAIAGLISGWNSYDGGKIMALGVIVGGAFVAAYWFSKKLAISIETGGGMILGLAFKRSVMENVAVDLPEALKAIELINRKVLESRRQLATQSL